MMYKSVQRRLSLRDHKIACPKCNANQIQLIGYIETYPARWRCRECGHKFEFEPTEKKI